jgi:predicted ATPase
MRRYQDAVAGSIARYDGYLAKFLGDGVLAYFGWPQAYEDQAERAVRSGLDAIAAITGIELENGSTLRGRVGIATGEVVIGDIIGETSTQSEAVVGETPNLAARLQTVAEPDQVVIGSTTHRLIGDLFDYRDLGLKSLKGIADPVPAWQVLGERAVESRFEAAHAGKLTGLVGREHELGLLLDRWMLVKGGEGQVVLLSGEAGIGKSRMVQALREHVRDQAHFRLRYQCSPYHSNSAFYPVIQRLERAAGFSAEDTTDAKLDKLEKLLELAADDIEAIAPLFAALLSLPAEDRYGPLELTPQQRRDQLVETMVDQLLALSRQRPVVFVLEDAHWIDPTTEYLLGEIMPLIADEPVFMLITYRPSYTPPWASHAHLTSIVLNRLGREQGAAIVRSVGGSRLADEFVERIVVRSGGVPLYVEELTKSVVEALSSGDEALAEDRIPATLQASLVARLDRLGDAKEIAQTGAVIGREFSHALLAAVADKSSIEVDTALDRLVQSELVLRRGTPPNATYTFKHALVQEAAYETLLKRTRQQYHHQVAGLLEKRFPETVATHPELVAHHYSEAGDATRAVHYWRSAGERARRLSANLEAIAYLTKGIEMLDGLPDDEERARQELALQASLGHANIVAKGHGAAGAEAAYARALELCGQLGDVAELAPTLFGLWRYYVVARPLDETNDVATRLRRLAEEKQDTELHVIAHYALGYTALCMGNFGDARINLEQGIAQYLPAQRSAEIYRTAHDPGVACRAYLGMTEWLLGYPERAQSRIRECVELAEELEDAYSLAYALCFAGANVSEFCGSDSNTVVERGLEVAEEGGFAMWIGFGKVHQMSLRFADQRSDSALNALRESVVAISQMGIHVITPYLMTLLARAYRRAGRIDDGLEVLEDARASLDARGEHWWEAEFERLRGEFLLSQSAENATDAELCFERALDISRSQEAKSLELRAAMSLARLWQQQGKEDEARRLLGECYTWFTEGFDTADLKEAKVLLDELKTSPTTRRIVRD